MRKATVKFPPGSFAFYLYCEATARITDCDCLIVGEPCCSPAATVRSAISNARFAKWSKVGGRWICPICLGRKGNP